MRENEKGLPERDARIKAFTGEATQVFSTGVAGNGRARRQWLWVLDFTMAA